MSPNRYWLSWSRRQRSFHIETEGEGVQSNFTAFVENRPTDYVPIGVFGSYEAARDFARRLKNKTEQRGIGGSDFEGREDES